MSAMEIAKEESIPSVCKIRATLFCSVCLDAVVEGEDRSIARLKCGHHFHLDCIGSAFNAKGRMQCPNCRQEEHGRWLYANKCCLNEDFFEGLNSEVDAEAYNAAAEMVSHAPWCPHQISYGHFSLAFEELDNSANGYLRPLQNVVHRVQVPGISGGQMGQYLTGMHLGGPLNHIEDIMALQMNYVGRAWNHSGRRSDGLQTGSMFLASNASWTSYGGSSQNNTHNGAYQQPNVRHPSLGFLMGSPQSVQAGYTNTIGFFRRSQMYTRQTRHGDAFQTAERTRQMSPSARGQRREPAHGNGAFYSSGQRPNRAYHGERMRWVAEGTQMEASYAYGVPAHWWAWVPTETRSAAQNMAPNIYPYHEGQFSSTSRPTPLVEGSLEHSPQGPYAWVLY